MTTLAKIIVITLVSISIFTSNLVKNNYDVKKSLKTLNSSIQAAEKQE